jgi:multiple sugar transport system substrate-binding protein
MKFLAGMIKKHIDRVLFVSALILLALTLAHRLGGRRVIAMAAAPTLVFTQWWEEHMEEGALKSLIGEFEALHPDIKIKLERQSRGGLYASLTGAPGGAPEAEEGAAAPPGGDILALDPLWVPALTGKGIIEESYPLLTYINPLFYNIEILKAAGFSGPPKTREEFLSMARGIKKRDRGLYGIALSAGTDSLSLLGRNVYPWVWAAGTTLLDGGKPRLTQGPVIETLEFLRTLAKEELLAPGSFSWEEDQIRDAFIRGRTAFMIAPVMDIEVLKAAMGNGFGVSAIPVPGRRAEQPVFGASGWRLGLSSRSEHKEEARTFITFLREQSGRIAALAHAIPGDGTSFPSGEDPLYAKVSDMCIAAEFLREFDGVSATEELEERFRFFLGELLEGRLSAPAAAEGIQKSWEAALAGGAPE